MMGSETSLVTAINGVRFPLGEPDGSRSPRIEALSHLLIASGLKAPVRPRIRDELWVKLWGNLAFNPLSALTCATLDRLTGQPDLRAICRTMMTEAKAVAEALGVHFAIDVERRIDGAAEVGAHKTSMLQDLERGRPMEIDALLGAVVLSVKMALSYRDDGWPWRWVQASRERGSFGMIADGGDEVCRFRV